MEDLLKIIQKLDSDLFDEIGSIVKNDRFSIRKVPIAEELPVLKTRLNMLSAKKISIPMFEETIANLESYSESSIFRYIIIGKKDSFIFYVDTDKENLISHYKVK